MLEFYLTYSAMLMTPALLVICALAIWKGGPAERRSAPILLGVGLIATVVALMRLEQGPMVMLFLDALVAAAFLWLAMRHRSLWLAAAMIAQGGAFAIHTLLLEQQGEAFDPDTYRTFVIGLNLTTWIVLLLMLGGTIAAWRKRAKSRVDGGSAAPGDGFKLPSVAKKAQPRPAATQGAA